MPIGSEENDDIRVKGDDGTDGGALISSILDGSIKRLAVDTIISSVAGGVIPSWKNNLIYDDFNVANGGVARDTTIGNVLTNVYSVLGSGEFSGFLITLENFSDEWLIDLVIDGNNIFGINGISTKDLEKNSLYGFDEDKSSDNSFLGFTIVQDTLRWGGPLDYPISYDTSIILKVKYIKGGSKKFRAGLGARTI